jgi:hypothetical protein
LEQNNNVVSPKKKNNFLTVVIGLEFIGVLIAVLAVFAKVAFNNLPLSVTLFGVGLLLALPGIIYLVRYLIEMIFDKNAAPAAAQEDSIYAETPIPVKTVKDAAKIKDDVSKFNEIYEENDEIVAFSLPKMPGVPESLPEYISNEELEYLYNSCADEEGIAALVDELKPKEIKQIKDKVDEELENARMNAPLVQTEETAETETDYSGELDGVYINYEPDEEVDKAVTEPETEPDVTAAENITNEVSTGEQPEPDKNLDIAVTEDTDDEPDGLNETVMPSGEEDELVGDIIETAVVEPMDKDMEIAEKLPIMEELREDEEITDGEAAELKENVLTAESGQVADEAAEDKELPAQAAVLSDNPDEKITKQKPAPTSASQEVLAARKLNAAAKKNLFIKQNLDRYLKNYFIEVAACFLMNRDEYKDTFGIAPYNKITIKKSDIPGVADRITFSMSNTIGKLYKFCTYLIDAERFLTHEELYKTFVTLLESGTSLVRISEKLFIAYKKIYKKDFVNRLTNKENFDNVLVLASNSYIIDNNSFRDVFNRIPFSIPAGLTDENIVSYLTRADIEERFTSAFPNFGDIGFTNVWTAMYVCFINSIKQNLSAEHLATAILKDTKRVTKMLIRAAKRRTKMKIKLPA